MNTGQRGVRGRDKMKDGGKKTGVQETKQRLLGPRGYWSLSEEQMEIIGGYTS